MTDDRSLVGAVARRLRLGEPFGTFRYAVDSNDVERFAAGSRDQGAAWRSDVAYISGQLPAGTPAPPGYFIALDPYERGDLDIDPELDRLPVRWTGGGNAWNEVRYVRPFRVGDRVQVEVTFTDVYEKDGSAGRLLFRVRRNRYTTVDGEPIAESTNGHIRAFDASSLPEGGIHG